MILLDLTHTSHSRARTGIQRVARSLRRELLARGLGQEITWDRFGREWRLLEPWERAMLDAPQASHRRRAAWPAFARWRGRWRRWWSGRGVSSVGVASTLVAPPAAPAHADQDPRLPAALVVPELFSADVARALPALRQRLRGPAVALFHDAIALQYPELSPPKTVARFPFYLQELASFDRIAAVSEDSRAVLLDYWRWLGLRTPPVVATLPLGIEVPSPLPAASAAARPAGQPIQVLCVGTIEARKNHLALLEAAEGLWREGQRFELRLIGLAQPETGRRALARLEELRSAGRPVRYDGPVDEATLTAAYAACDCTVYPSVVEGFGLPVLESLAAGKPCVCSGRGALGESAAGGGCLALDRVDTPALMSALRHLLTHPTALAELTVAARRRTFRTWADYARDLVAWMEA